MENYPITLDLSAADRMTDEQFFKFCADNRDLRIERNADGTITIMSPTGLNSGDLCAEIITELKIWNRLHRTGTVSDSSTGFRLQDKSVFAPDASWIAERRMIEISKSERNKFVAACPNFIVELASPSDNLPSLRLKMQNWLENGVELGWLINPKDETVEIFEQEKKPVLVKGFDNELNGDPYLPGFVLDLSLLRR